MKGDLLHVIIERGLYQRIRDCIVQLNDDTCLSHLAEYDFKINKRARQRLGLCDFTNQYVEISQLHWDHGDPDDVDDTILHEVAHVLAGHVYEVYDHGPKWKDIMVLLGCEPKALKELSVKELVAAKRSAKYTYKCLDCGYRFYAFRIWKHDKIHTTCQYKKNIGKIILEKQHY